MCISILRPFHPLHFTHNSYFLIIIPHIFWGLESLSKGTFASLLLAPPPPPLLKGMGRCTPLSGVPEDKLIMIEVREFLSETIQALVALVALFTVQLDLVGCL